MSKMLLYGFLLYLLYRFVFDLVIPMGKATSQMKQKMKEMQQQQAAQQQQYQQRQSPPKASAATPVQKEGDYIDFEEVK